ncbi:MAG: putative zinc ribbon domain protein [Syntrophorhabdus sp. PtaU1.Bin002]|nr:MAG: putative zinc ribbon domain protein [Syntrophorhabdus sp. PtaU1.Bin002]
MEQELKTIYEAQGIDLQIIENEKKIHSTPQKLEEMDQEINMMRERVEREQEIIEELEKERKKKEKELEMEKEKIKKFESKLYEVKTNKEYQALLKEIETAKQANDKEEEEIIEIMVRIEELKKDFSSTSEKLKEIQKIAEVEKNKLQKEMESIDKIILKLKQQRDNLLSVIDDDLRKTYSMLIERRNGLAVVNVKNGVCLGCFMNIPPQLFIEATKNSRVILCPSCNRIFYFTEEQ